MPAAPDLRQARWFPVDLDVRSRNLFFLELEDELVAQSNFLDNRMHARFADAWPVAVPSIANDIPAGRIAWLFHTSFCGSTLAARALHLPPYATCLREPLLLRRLADARFAGEPVEDLVAPAVRLLSRPWNTGDVVLVKPTHAALNLVPELLNAAPGSHGVLLTSSLEDFLISNLKKPADSQARIPELANRALRIGAFASRLEEGALAPPDLLCAAALQWAAQREVVADFPRERVRLVDMEALLADFEETMARCADWLALPLPRPALHERCGQIGGRNAKALEVPYDASRRAAEARFVAGHFAHELKRALEWAERWLLPFMRDEARRIPSERSLP